MREVKVNTDLGYDPTVAVTMGQVVAEYQGRNKCGEYHNAGMENKLNCRVCNFKTWCDLYKEK